MALTVTPDPYQTVLDGSGNPISGAKVFVYLAGTTTKTNTYTDSTGNTANANPIIADSAGRFVAFLDLAVSYKFVYALPTDSDPPLSPFKTVDDISAVPLSSSDLDIVGTAGEALNPGNAVYLSDGGGGRTAGRWYLGDADNTYSSTLAPQIGMVQTAISSGATGGIRIAGRITGLSGLTAGSLYYMSTTGGAITATAPANAKPIAVADSTTSVVLQPPTPLGTGTIAGLVSIGAQTIAGVKTFSSAVAFGALPTGIGAFVTSYAAANTTKNNNTTMVDITGLSFAVLANSSYAFTFVLHAVSAAAADLKFTLTGPAAPTAIRYGLNQSSAGAIADAAAFGTEIQIATNAADMSVTISGQLRNGANAGTVQLQFAQLAADASNSVIYAESSVMAWRLS